MDAASKHTFVIMGYKESEYLGECYEALERQTVKSKIIMTSSTPNDFQRNFARAQGVPYIVNPDRQGFAGDLNFAYAQADTDLVTMVHQDDILFPEYAERCLKFYEKRPDSLIIFTKYLEFTGEKFIDDSLNLKVKNFLLNAHYLVKDYIKSKFFKRFLLSLGNPISCPSICYVKNNIGDMRFDLDYLVSPEWELLIRLTKMDGGFTFVKKPLHAYRIHEGQITSVGLKNRIAEDKRVFNMLWPRPIAALLMKFYSFCYPKGDNK